MLSASSRNCALVCSVSSRASRSSSCEEYFPGHSKCNESLPRNPLCKGNPKDIRRDSSGMLKRLQLQFQYLSPSPIFQQRESAILISEASSWSDFAASKLECLNHIKSRLCWLIRHNGEKSYTCPANIYFPDWMRFQSHVLAPLTDLQVDPLLLVPRHIPTRLITQLRE